MQANRAGIQDLRLESLVTSKDLKSASAGAKQMERSMLCPTTWALGVNSYGRPTRRIRSVRRPCTSTICTATSERDR